MRGIEVACEKLLRGMWRSTATFLAVPARSSNSLSQQKNDDHKEGKTSGTEEFYRILIECHLLLFF